MEHMSTKFEMSLVGKLAYFLELQVRQTIFDTFVSQVKYAKNLGSKFGLDTAKHRRTHIGTHEKITQDEASNGVGHNLYSMGVCSRYQSCPKESHLVAIKKIIKYVSGIIEFEIWYTHDTTTCLMRYCDV